MLANLVQFYLARFRINLAVQFQYRVAMGIWMLGLILEPLVYLCVWTSVAKTQGGTVGGFGPGDFAAYYLIMLLVHHACLIWHMFEYDFIIRQGILSNRLLRPIHPIHGDISENITYKVFMLVILLPAFGLLWYLFKPEFHTTVGAVALFPFALLMAGALAFFAGWALAMAAFWTNRTAAVNQAWFVAMFFFSGQAAPLSLLPPWMQDVAFYLPFRWMYSFPIELCLGRLDTRKILHGFGTQALWILGFLIIMNFAWRSGIKRYSASGG
ncbi:MAG: ABC-2 family transporter protein [Verrucomicrobiota bacterium]|nr:ABC-2 family transporter protein [Verrucomicrobiota bacterium]